MLDYAAVNPTVPKSQSLRDRAVTLGTQQAVGLTASPGLTPCSAKRVFGIKCCEGGWASVSYLLSVGTLHVTCTFILLCTTHSVLVLHVTSNTVDYIHVIDASVRVFADQGSTWTASFGPFNFPTHWLPRNRRATPWVMALLWFSVLIIHSFTWAIKSDALVKHCIE